MLINILLLLVITTPLIYGLGVLVFYKPRHKRFKQNSKKTIDFTDSE